MRVIVVSDLHLGAKNGADVARLQPVRERLLEALGRADRVVLLGDVLELRERPLPELLPRVRPFFEAVDEAVAGKPVTLMAGNHDHALAEPYLTRGRLDGSADPEDQVWRVDPRDGIAGRLAEWMPRAEVSFAYPSLRLRADVYLTHGHYLDLHLTVPRLEALAASALSRVTGRRRNCRSIADYEAVLSPMYAFHHALAQGYTSGIETGSMSRMVWQRATDPRGPALPRFLIGRVTIPGAVAAMNRIGLGPFNPSLSGGELRRAGLRAMGDVVRTLGVDADYVLFGHTHRPGPLEGDDPREWQLPEGPQLYNTGSWYHEWVFLRDDPRSSPYWPGTVAWVGEEGPPELENVLPDVELRAVSQPVRAR